MSFFTSTLDKSLFLSNVCNYIIFKDTFFPPLFSLYSVNIVFWTSFCEINGIKFKICLLGHAIKVGFYLYLV